MDLRKQIVLLEKDVVQLEEIKARRKVFLSKPASAGGKGGAQQQQQRPLPLASVQPSSSGGEGVKKRKLFSHSSVGSNFMSW